jgi:shikimate kinase
LVDLDAGSEEVYSSRKVQALRDGGPIVYLEGDIDRLAAKTEADPTRPVIDPLLSAAAVMRRREPFYTAAADWTIFVERETRQQAAEMIAAKFAS